MRTFFSLHLYVHSFLLTFQFLFHYSKARNSVGAVQDEVSKADDATRLNVRTSFFNTQSVFSVLTQSESVHPLMRLRPKLSHSRNKKVVLLVRSDTANTHTEKTKTGLVIKRQNDNLEHPPLTFSRFLPNAVLCPLC